MIYYTYVHNVLFFIIFEHLNYPIIFEKAYEKIRHSLVSQLFISYSLGSHQLSLNLSSLTLNLLQCPCED